MTRTIILEGPDGSGKSTLAKQIELYYLGSGLSVKHTHHGLYMKETGADLLKIYTESILDQSADVHIIDRCYLSEPVYGSVMRGVDRLGSQGCSMLHRLCRARGVVEVICLPPWHVVLKNWSDKRKLKWDPVKRTGDYVDAREKAFAIYKSYHTILIDMEPNFTSYCYTARSSPFVELMALCPKKLPEGVIGSPTAKYLIVGEQVNHKGGMAHLDLPFYELKNASAYLNDCLEKAEIDDNDLAFTNALPYDGTCTDKHRHRRAHRGERDLKGLLWQIPSVKRVIALGLTAARVVRAAGIEDFVVLKHPAYQKRFEHGKTEEYVQQLKEACSPCTF